MGADQVHDAGPAHAHAPAHVDRAVAPGIGLQTALEVVAGIGVVVMAATALRFRRGRKVDINVRGAAWRGSRLA